MGQMNRIPSNNTTIATTGGITRVTLHGTCVVEFDAVRITLRTGGYDTVTTRARMNQASNQFGLGYSVARDKGRTYVRRNGKPTFELDEVATFDRN